MQHYFAQQQPKHGETMLLCRHLADKDIDVGAYFFYIKEGISFYRPDLTPGHATWLIMCDECQKEHPSPTLKDLQKLIGGDAKWKGNDPVIRSSPNVN